MYAEAKNQGQTVAAAIGAGAESGMADLGGGVVDTTIEILGGTVTAKTVSIENRIPAQEADKIG